MNTGFMDGHNLLPIILGQMPAVRRKIYFRFRAGQQRAVRDGDMKYLRIDQNEFLFNVVKDPRERANLKSRQAETFARLKDDWEAWEKTMLPQKPGLGNHRHPADALADHIGRTNPKK